MQIKPITVDYVAKHQGDFLQSHWEEIALDKVLTVLAPDWSRYAALEDAGVLMAIGAFDDAGEMVGYSVTFINAHIHYRNLVYAHNDVLYVRPEHRNSKVGLKLIRETERLAKERGAGMVSWHAKENTTLASLLPRMGYRVQDIIFSKGV